MQVTAHPVSRHWRPLQRICRSSSLRAAAPAKRTLLQLLSELAVLLVLHSKAGKAGSWAGRAMQDESSLATHAAQQNIVGGKAAGQAHTADGTGSATAAGSNTRRMQAHKAAAAAAHLQQQPVDGVACGHHIRGLRGQQVQVLAEAQACSRAGTRMQREGTATELEHTVLRSTGAAANVASRRTALSSRPCKLRTTCSAVGAAAGQLATAPTGPSSRQAKPCAAAQHMRGVSRAPHPRACCAGRPRYCVACSPRHTLPPPAPARQRPAAAWVLEGLSDSSGGRRPSAGGPGDSQQQLGAASRRSPLWAPRFELTAAPSAPSPPRSMAPQGDSSTPVQLPGGLAGAA